jgi:hypothetical protein
MSIKKSVRVAVAVVCCGGLVGALPVTAATAATAAKSKTTSTTDFNGTARKN